MPDLGMYAQTVLLAYAVSLLILAVFVALSLRRANRVKAHLETLERRVKENG